MQHDDLFINNIMLHWKLDVSLKIRVCNRGCTSHTVRMLIYCGMRKPKRRRKFKKKGEVMALELFRDQSMRHQVSSKYYIKEVENFTVNKLAWQLCD